MATKEDILGNQTLKNEYEHKIEYEKSKRSSPLVESIGYKYKYHFSDEILEKHKKLQYDSKKSHDSGYQGSLLTMEEKYIATDIKLRHQLYKDQVANFINSELMLFDYKQSLCMMNRCYADLTTPKPQMRICLANCTSKGKKFHDFIKQRVDSNHSELNNCLEKASDPKHKTYFNFIIDCYDKYFTAYDRIKQETNREQSFYRS